MTRSLTASAGTLIRCGARTLLGSGLLRNLSTTMGHSTGLIREQCPVW